MRTGNARIVGRVIRDTSGGGAAGASISVQWRTSAYEVGAACYTSADSAGRFVVERLAAGTYFLMAFHPNLSGSASARVKVPPGGSAPVTLHALPIASCTTSLDAGRVAGAVIDDASGTPVHGAQVTTLGGLCGLVTDERGTFVFERVPVGTAAVVARRIGYAAGQRAAAVARDTTRELVLRLRPTTMALEDLKVMPDRQRRRIPRAVTADWLVRELGGCGWTCYAFVRDSLWLAVRGRPETADAILVALARPRLSRAAREDSLARGMLLFLLGATGKPRAYELLTRLDGRLSPGDERREAVLVALGQGAAELPPVAMRRLTAALGSDDPRERHAACDALAAEPSAARRAVLAARLAREPIRSVKRCIENALSTDSP